MADAQSPEAFLASIPDDPSQTNPEAAASTPASQGAPDAGLLGGLAQSLGLWDAPQAKDPATAAQAVAGKEAQRQAVKDAQSSGPLGAINSALGAPLDAFGGTLGGGMMKGVFEMKDTLFGDTPPSQQSDLRYAIEQDVKDDNEASVFNGVAAAIGQFSAGMLGVGKLTGPLKMLPFASKVKTSKAVLDAGKAALAGMIAFDPHEARLSNAIQGTFLANPVNEWLSAKDTDGVLEGRLKNALESIGMDATLGAAFIYAGKIFKARQLGNFEEAGRLADEFEEHQAAKLEEEANQHAATADATTPQADPTADGGSPADSAARTDNPATGNGDGSAGSEAGPQGAAEAQAVTPQGEQGQPAPSGSRPELVAANSNSGGAQSFTPEGGPASVNVKVRPDVLNPVDPTSNGFGVPKRPVRMQNPKPYIQFADENTTEVMQKSIMDAEAIDGHGGYSEAVDAGYKFGDTANALPFHKFTTETEIDNFIARATDAQREALTDLKGGEVMTDARVDNTVKNMVKLTGADPGFILGKIQQAGRLAPQLVADMETGYTLAQKAWADTYALNARYMIGDTTGYGTKEAMWQDIQHRLSVATTFYGAARSITANAGRAMRRMRREYMFDPSKFADVDPGRLSALIAQANANPQAIKRILDNRSVLKLITSEMEFLRVSGLISGPVSQVINVVTSGFNAVMAPATRLLGATMLAPFKTADALGQIGKDLRQYHAFGGSAIDSFKAAGQAFLDNDSLLVPHGSENLRANMAPGAQAYGKGFFRPIVDGDHSAFNNLVYNTLSVAGGAASVPTRLLGATDELIKQTTYQSYVRSRAAYKASTEGAAQGLKGADLKAYVKSEVQQALDGAFDSAGRATDGAAMEEAQKVVFQADLGATGKKIQGLAQANFLTRFVLPFTKTPMNIIKQGARLTPGLNLAMKEFREELLGRAGFEAQARATGQMGLGVMYMTAAGYLASSGKITGGGPSDPKAKQALIESGWRPYSFVYEDAEGNTKYLQFNRFDPVAMPMGIAADLIHHWQNTEWDGSDDTASTIGTEVLTGLTVALSRQFAQKSYLLGASQFLDATMNPDQKGNRWASAAAASLVPFSSLTRQLDQDEYMKDAQGLADSMLAVTPGMGEGIPHRRDFMGEKVGATGMSGTVLTTGKAEPIDLEVQRIATRTGMGFGKMAPVQQGVDLRDITLPDGRTAYEKLQDLTSNPRRSGSGTTLRQALNKLVQKDAYAKLPDGQANDGHTKSGEIGSVIQKYRKAAWSELLRSEPQVKEAFKSEKDKAQDRFRQMRGLPLKAPEKQDENTTGHLLDAFGLGD